MSSSSLVFFYLLSSTDALSLSLCRRDQLFLGLASAISYGSAATLCTLKLERSNFSLLSLVSVLFYFSVSSLWALPC